MLSSQRALIFANGVLPDRESGKNILQPGDALIAADGGYLHLRRLGLLPSLLIGDLDSLSPLDIAEAHSLGVKVQQFPEDKDETDLELAIREALAQGFHRICIIAALGGRLDQTLGNIFLLTQPALADYDVRLDDGTEEVFVIRRKGILEGHAGDVVSLLPLGQPVSGITTEGLRYPLHAETLYPDRTRGISNVMLAERAVVEISSGLLLCIHTRSKES